MPSIPQIISVDDYDEIRDRLGSLSSDVLPDEVLQKLSYLGKAEAIVRNRIPDWSAIKDADGDDYIYLRAAVISYCAYLLIPRVQSLVKSEDILDYKYVGYSPDDWAKKAQALLYDYNSDINQMSTQDTVDPFIFTVDGPTRANESLIC